MGTEETEKTKKSKDELKIIQNRSKILNDYSKNFYTMINAKYVSVTLVDGSVISGVLGASNTNPYDIIISTEEEDYLINKAQILKILFNGGKK